MTNPDQRVWFCVMIKKEAIEADAPDITGPRAYWRLFARSRALVEAFIRAEDPDACCGLETSWRFQVHSTNSVFQKLQSGELPIVQAVEIVNPSSSFGAIRLASKANPRIYKEFIVELEATLLAGMPPRRQMVAVRRVWRSAKEWILKHDPDTYFFSSLRREIARYHSFWTTDEVFEILKNAKDPPPGIQKIGRAPKHEEQTFIRLGV